MILDSSVPPGTELHPSVSWRTVLISSLFFGIAMGWFEAAIVVYLRELFYPDGFVFPLVAIPFRLVLIEVGREAATIIMLITLASAGARNHWSRFGWFVFVFGVWDVFYYVWLKAMLGWPETIFDRDILFLIPLPWIGPVIAPVLVSVLMIIVGVYITRHEYTGGIFRSTPASWVFVLTGTLLILWTFMNDTDAALRQMPPKPYRYDIFAFGYICYLAGCVQAWKRNARKIASHI